MMVLLLEATLRSVALSLTVGIAVAALRLHNPHLLKTVWFSVLLASIAMPCVMQWSVLPSVSVPDSLVSLAAATASSQTHVIAESWTQMTRLAPAFFIVYVAVAVVLLARSAFGLVCVWRIRRSAAPLVRENWTSCDIRFSAKMSSPATFGSTILLPENAVEWEQSRLEAVLTHERSHVLHKDCYVQWLARLHSCIFWFNPVAWWLQSHLAHLAETTSDDAVIEIAADRAEYARTLLEIAQASGQAAHVAVAAARSNISARIERIISDIPPASPPPRVVRAMAAALLIPLVAVAAVNVQQVHGILTSDAAPMTPRIINSDKIDTLGRFYPALAKQFGKGAAVTIALTLDAAGRVVDASVINPDTANAQWGFEEAGVRLARSLRFNNPRGVPTHSRIRVKFDPKKH